MLTEKKHPTGGPNKGEPTDKADRQQEYILVQVALRLFHEQGYKKVTLGDIAKAAGVTVKETNDYFPSLPEICHGVIEAHLDNQTAHFEEINQNNNPRQRLSQYLDSLIENTDNLVAWGCPVTNLYFDVRREDDALSEHAAKLILNRLNWITEQFVLITRVADVSDLPERLTSAIHGMTLLAQATGRTDLIRTQVNQLKSWIRSM